MTLRRCSRCVLPETHETITFDEAGVCNICRQQEYKQSGIDWVARKRDLDELIARHRDKSDYDCIVPFSGGKDSTWTLYYLVKQYGIKPLVVRFDHGFFRPNLQENTTRTLRRLGVDFLQFTPNWIVVRKLMLQSLLEKGDFCWHCHTGVVSYPLWTALRYQVPLIMWGEPSSEYTAYYTYEQRQAVDETHFNRVTNLGLTALDMVVRLDDDIDERDLKPFTYPPASALRTLDYRSEYLGSYIPWNARRQAQIIEEDLGWQGDAVENVPVDYRYEKIECYMQGVRDYIKYMKRGYTRPTHLASLDIRHQRMDRSQAVELIATHEGRRPPSLDLFLELLGLTEQEFNDIVKSHAVAPYVHNPGATTAGVPVPDFDQWPREGAMPRAQTEVQLARWYRRARSRA